MAYEIVEKISMPPEKQIEILKNLGFKTVKTEKSSDSLESLLERFKKDSEFAIDGIVIKKDISCERETKGNPKHIFAFKMLTQHYKGIVSQVEWNPSKTGKLKPKIKFEPPIKVGEVKVSYVNAYNAKFVREKKLGSGACVNIYLSGDVIPCILSVEKGSENVTFPDGIFDGTDIVGNATNPIAEIHSFLVEIGVKGIGPASLRKNNIFSIKTAIEYAKKEEKLPTRVLFKKFLIPFVGGEKTAETIAERLGSNFTKEDLKRIRLGEKTIKKCFSRYDEMRDALSLYMKYGSICYMNLF